MGTVSDDDIEQEASRWPDTYEPRRWDPELRRRRRALTRLVAIMVLVALVVFGGPALFFSLEGPGAKPLTLPIGPGGTVGPVNGTWTVVAPSAVEYRVEEVLFGMHHLAVGTTSKASGSVTIKGATVISAKFSVDMASVKSDAAGRNVAFNNWIMDTGSHPKGYFTLTRAIDLGKVPAERHVVHVDAVGDLTLRGKTRSVRFPLSLERYGNGIDAEGSLTIRFGLWGIPNPSFAITRVASTGTIEVLLHLTRSK